MTLVVATSVGLTFTLLLYAWLTGRSIGSRIGYAFFVCLLPAVGTFVVLKLTKLSVSWRGVVLSTWITAAVLYFLLFLLIFISTFRGIFRVSSSIITIP